MPAELAGSLEATPDGRLLQAEAMVRSYCGWHIAPVRTTVLRYAYPDSLAHMLPTLQLVAVTSITLDDVVLDPASYVFTLAGVLTRQSWPWALSGGWFSGADWGSWTGGAVLEITFEHGFAVPPPDVTAVVQAMAARAVANPGSLTREQVGPFAYSYSAAGVNASVPLSILEAERAVLDLYKLPPRP